MDDQNEHEITDRMKETLDNKSYIQNYLILSIVVVLIAFLVSLVLFQEDTKCNHQNIETLSIKDFKTYWAYGKSTESGYLHNVFAVLERMGYKNDPNSTDWDLLWAHDYPFRTLHSKLNNLQSHQKVNKLPGSGYITNKVDLATSGLKYIPVAFRLPNGKNKFLDYIKSNANDTFVEKSNDHRNIHIRKIDDIDLDGTGKFIQKFVDDPFLVGGYKFDIGIYTIITSVDPLRVYIYNDDALLRFCPVKYEPFDPENIDKYVVGDDYLPTWEVPDLKYYYNVLGFGMKESLNAYIRSNGKDPSIIWKQIEESIRIVTLAKEQQIINAIIKFPSKRNFFEMMRFDFVLTADLKIYLMEANMSPNLSSAHFPLNKLLFEQVLFNIFGLVGIATRERKNTLAIMSELEEQMQVADKNIMVFSKECGSTLCKSSCISPVCQLCRTCFSSTTRANIIQAYKEHVNRGACKRIFPPPLDKTTIDLDEDLEEYSSENQLQYRWFQGKCLMDDAWCV